LTLEFENDASFRSTGKKTYKDKVSTNGCSEFKSAINKVGLFFNPNGTSAIANATEFHVGPRKPLGNYPLLFLEVVKNKVHWDGI
jgi:hypothetical protein